MGEYIMGKLHNTYIDSACNYIVHALNALSKLIDRGHTTLTRTLIIIAVIIVLSGAASAEDSIFGNISTRVVTNTSATILWECPTTPVKSQIEYGLTTSYGNITTEKDFSYWRMTDITGLSEDTLYHYRIRTTDLAGNSVISADYDFTTINSTVLDNILKAARNDGGLPKTYYVSTSGSDSNDGLSLSTAWASPHYASITVDAGDTIWVVNGSYNTDFIPGVYDPGVDFGLNAGTGDGIAEAPITMKAYNGTPEIAGDIEIRYDYITFDGFIINDSYSHAIDIRGTTGVKLLNCTVNKSGSAADGVYMQDSKYTTLINCTVRNAGWNAYGFKPTTSFPSAGHHVILKNCAAYDSLYHNQFDIHFDYMTIEGCIANNSLLAPMQLYNSHIIVNNFTAANGNNGVKLYTVWNTTVMNCTLDQSIYNTGYIQNTKIYNNYIYNDPTYGIYINTSDDIVLDGNEVYASSAYTYRIVGIGSATIRDEVVSPYKIWSPDGVTISIEFTDGKLFTDDRTGAPVYYPDRSNLTFNDSGVANIRSYNITLQPTHAYLYDVTVDTWDEATDTYRITARSTESENPTWVNLTTKSAYTAYNVTRAGEPDNIRATTDADGVLRYYYDKTWNGSQTFEVSYAFDGVDPASLVTNLRNEPPTSDAVTLHWGCSVSNINHYNIYQNGTLLNTIGNNYYTVTNLLPDTTYTFNISATTTDGITSENTTLWVQTAAEEAEDFGSNTVHIANGVTASRGDSATVPIMSYNATGVACAGVKLTYDASVVTVTGATEGDFTTLLKFDDMHAADGWVVINTYISGTQLTGDTKVADVTLVAVGEAGDTSSLDMEILSMADQSGYSVPGTVSNGSFTVVVDNSPPVVIDPSASQLIPEDTDGVPSWGETATLSVTVVDESDIASVTIDLSAIGGSPVQPMTHTGGNVWSVATSASAETSPQTYELQVCATDSYGYANMSESVELVVMQNGDVTGDGGVRSDDVALLENYVTYSGQYTVSSEFVADVTGDGVVDIADAMLLANRVAYPDQYTLR